MLHIQNILVPLDLSEGHEHALGVAHSLARDHLARMTLVTVPALPVQTISEVYLSPQDSPTLIEEARNRLVSIATKITDRPVEISVVMGMAGAEIVQAAVDSQADLIVMETHGRSGLSRVLLGSVAEYVLRHAPCPVLTIKPETASHLSTERERPLLTCVSDIVVPECDPVIGVPKE